VALTTGAGRRRLLLAGALAVVALVGGRWAAIETAEQAWAAGMPGGEAYTNARHLAWLVGGVVLLAATAWSTLQLYLVYRSIGSVQVPRRVGDLEILEAVPRSALLGATLGGGLAAGWLLTLGTGDWWLAATLAADPPVFGVVEPLLERDLGYYVGTLPWSMRLQNRALLASLAAVVVVAALYLAIGALRFERGRPVAGAHARTHLGTLLATLAAVVAWGALLDPAEVVAGAHGPLDHAALTARLPGALVVAVVAGGVAALSLAWAWRGRPAVIPAAWAVLLVTQLTAYALMPALARTARGAAGAALPPALAAERLLLERMAHGLDALRNEALTPYSSPAAALQAFALWDALGVAAVARHADVFGRSALGVTAAPHPTASLAQPAWLVVPVPDAAAWQRATPAPSWAEIHRGRWSRTAAPSLAFETDTGLAFEAAAVTDSVAWFGAGFTEFALASPDTWPALRSSGIRLEGRWRRAALALALQSLDLLRSENGALLLWRRDAGERLERLLPAADFDAAAPLLADGALWWVAYGYVTSDLFPMVRGWDAASLPRYHRLGFVGTVNAATGDTRIYLAPGHDTLSATWATVFAPLVRPAAELPAPLAAALPFPQRGFELAAASLARARPDTAVWRSRPDRPFLVAAPGAPGGGGGWWIAQGYETSRPPAFVALLAGTFGTLRPTLVFWRPDTPAPRPPDLAGSPDLKPGLLRVWPAGDALFFAQAQFEQAAARVEPPPATPPVLRRIFLWWGERAGSGETRREALRDLLARQPGGALPDTTLADRWREARRLAASADSALARGDLQEFARLYEELRRVLAPPPPFR
jgi:hypothetical protein